MWTTQMTEALTQEFVTHAKRKAWTAGEMKKSTACNEAALLTDLMKYRLIDAPEV